MRAARPEKGKAKETIVTSTSEDENKERKKEKKEKKKDEEDRRSRHFVDVIVIGIVLIPLFIGDKILSPSITFAHKKLVKKGKNTTGRWRFPGEIELVVAQRESKSDRSRGDPRRQ